MSFLPGIGSERSLETDMGLVSLYIPLEKVEGRRLHGCRNGCFRLCSVVGVERMATQLSVIIRGATGDRTPDLMTASHALSQLSYSPKEQASLDARS